MQQSAILQKARDVSRQPTEAAVKHVVIMVQENHTTDHYFGGLAPWGANVATDGPVGPNPPLGDHPHDRHAYFRWLTGAKSATHEQLDTATVLPFYLHLAVTGAFLENHCSGFGTNSTPNHLYRRRPIACPAQPAEGAGTGLGHALLACTC